jgi:Spy/CpxP family protein refolding chaperone
MKAVIAALFTAVALSGAATQVHADPGFGPGPMGGFGRDPELMLEHMSDHLDLTDAQRQDIENIVEASKPEMQAIREQARANRQAIRTLDTSDPSYETALNNIAVSNGELATAGTLLAVRVRNEVHAVLTDEQREKLERSKQRMQKRLKRQMDPR